MGVGFRKPFCALCALVLTVVMFGASSGEAVSARMLLAASQRYLTAPADLPQLNITVPGSGDDLLFITTFPFNGMPANPWLLIYDLDGGLVYWQRGVPGGVYADFRPHSNGTLAWFEGQFNTAAAEGVFRIANSAYVVTRTVTGGHAALADIHDLVQLPNGNAGVLVYHNITRDLRGLGGLEFHPVIDTLLRELAPDNSVVFEWRASQHIAISETYEGLFDLPLKFFHGNALALDQDGNWLITSRHTSSVVKVARDTGSVMWRLGGKRNDFAFVNDGGFSYPHDGQRLPNGNLSLFDNGNKRGGQPYSRAVEYQMDEANKIVTRTWQYRATPDIFGAFMGNVQRMPSGNTLINWGGVGNPVPGNAPGVYREVRPDGSLAFEATLSTTQYGVTYRAFRLPWHATPAITPMAVITQGALTMSWNGATDVAAWQIEASREGMSFTPVLSQTRTGFETHVPLQSIQLACFLRARPLDAQGRVMQASVSLAYTCPPLRTTYLPVAIR